MKITLLVFVSLFTLICHFSSAQISDSLYNALPEHARPANKQVLSITDKQNILHNANLLRKHEKELEQIALWLKEECTNTINCQLKKSSLAALTAYYFNVAPDSCKKYYRKLATCDDGAQANNLMADAYLGAAETYFYNDLYDTALQASHTSLDYAVRLKDTGLIVNSYDNLSLIHTYLTAYDKGLEYMDKLLAIYPRYKLWDENYVLYLLNKVVIYNRQYTHTKSMQAKLKSLRLIRDVMSHEAHNSKYWFKACYNFLGYLNFLDSNYLSAIQLFDSSMLPAYHDSSRFFGVKNIYSPLYKAISLIKLGRFAEGKKMLEQLDVSRPHRLSMGIRQAAYEALSEAAEAMGNNIQALEYYKKFKLYTDTLDLQEQRIKAYETEQKYNLVKLQNENLKNEQEKQRIKFIGIIAIACLVVAVLLVYLLYRKQQVTRLRERQALSDELDKLEQQKEAEGLKQREEYEQAVSGLRKTISRDIHDEVGSSLAMLPMMINDVKQNTLNPETAALLAGIEAEARSVYTQVREFIYRLHHSARAASYDVCELLENLDLRFGRGTGLQITYEVNKSLVRQYFTVNQHREMYRIIKEAVTNTVKHSNASNIHIDISCNNEYFFFEIADNGKGMQDGSSKGLGLAAIEQRLLALGGKFAIASSINGLRLSGSFPVSQD
ncbi:sensor histidine kinase [Foetidibacter luteolus]|uniref:sensor histidine kinase n=1 Tax=Foetidibacter luteolus TaxID=2608880 RepID=UPI00129A638F|nr:histidine kinase [Foetidibacter luteolus]